MLIDTGSSLTWVPTFECPVDQCQSNHFWTNMTSTFKDYGIQQKAQYGAGTIEGNLVSDQIHVE